jgi:hypothetical protein
MSDHTKTRYVLAITPGIIISESVGLALLEHGTTEPQHLYMVIGKVAAAAPYTFEGEFEAFELGGFTYRARTVEFPQDFDAFLRQQLGYLSAGGTLDFKYSGECIELAVVVMAIPSVGRPSFQYATRVHHLRYVEPSHAPDAT